MVDITTYNAHTLALQDAIKCPYANSPYKVYKGMRPFRMIRPSVCRDLDEITRDINNR